jgi:hypothetical protein
LAFGSFLSSRRPVFSLPRHTGGFVEARALSKPTGALVVALGLWALAPRLASGQPAPSEGRAWAEGTPLVPALSLPAPSLAPEPDGLPTDAGTQDEGLPRPLAAVLSVVPGILLNGSGQFALGHRDTAYRLFAMQGIGTALILLGALPIGLTAASRYVTGPAAGLAVAGLSLGSTAWFADMFGTMVPLELRGEPELSLPRIEAELGYRYVHHPSVLYGNVLVNRLTLRWEGLRLEPSALIAVDGLEQALRARIGYRYFGPRAAPAPRARDGSFLDLEVAVGQVRFPAQGFSIATGELFPSGRLDLAVLSPELRGAFSELGLGFGLQRFDYELGPGREVPGDYALVLLARFGFGIYLGAESAPRGELRWYYDHRHDEFAGGTHQAFVGIAGHVGMDAQVYLTEQLGLRSELELGGGTVAGLSLLVRDGVAR